MNKQTIKKDIKIHVSFVSGKFGNDVAKEIEELINGKYLRQIIPFNNDLSNGFLVIWGEYVDNFEPDKN